MKERILEVLQDEKTPLKYIEVYHRLGLETAEELKLVQDTLEEMNDKGEIYKTNREKFILFKNVPGLFCGKLQVTRSGTGFLLLPESEDIHIPASNFNGAMNNDYVVCEVVEKGLKPEGRVIKVLKRNNQTIVGTMVAGKKGDLIFEPDEKNLGASIKIDPDSLHNCVWGSKVIVDIGQLGRDKMYHGRVIKIIGHKDDPGMDIISIAGKYGIFTDFGPKVEKELEKIPDEVDEKDLHNRRDLTDKMIFTIDGDDTKDIDDAISLEYDDEGNYILGVHIADVSHYVKENTALGDAAFERGTSSYLADTVIPMIHHKLSNGICSLHEKVIRLTISCQMTIDPQGKVIYTEIFPSFIKSRKKMTYKCVNKILMENTVPDGYEEFKDTLISMNELAHKLRANQVKKGYLDFDLDEPKIIQNDEGVAVDVIKVDRGDGEKLIEAFMIIANESVASYIENMDLPFIYRVHGEPDEEKINDFVKLTQILGYKLETRFHDVTPKTMQKLLNELRDKPEFKVLSSVLLRSMKKAIYSKDNIGHFGLASQSYTHFTSPIRRFPDLTVHRLLRTYLFDNDLGMQTINYYESALVQIAEHSSEREQAAINAERDVDSMKMAEYMEAHIGEEYEGIITNVASFGFFVQLDNMIEGLVPVRTLVDDHYNYVEDLMALVGSSTNNMYQLGKRVKVKVSAASKENSTVDFDVLEVINGNTKQRS